MNHPGMLPKSAAPATVKSSRGHFISGEDLRLEDFINESNFFEAYKSASKGKHGRFGCFRYSEELFLNFSKYCRQILDGTYIPAPCHSFEIWCSGGQKIRKITAPTFSDGVVQHVFYKAVYKIFSRRMIFDSYGCRKWKGAHRSADRIQEFIRKSPVDSYYLQIDIRKYYYSIRHDILRESLARTLKDERIVDYLMAFAGPEEVGLQVGCLLSQLFGMIYLDRFDHYCKRVLKVRKYVRYVDDIVFIGLTKEGAHDLKKKCEDFLEKHLSLRLSKWKIAPLARGINFCGFRSWRERRLLRRRSVRNFQRALRRKRFESALSILAHAKHSTTYRSMLAQLKAAVGEADFGRLSVRVAKEAGLSARKVRRARRAQRNPLLQMKAPEITLAAVRALGAGERRKRRGRR